MEKFHKNPIILNGGGKFPMRGGRCRCEEILRCAQDDGKNRKRSARVSGSLQIVEEFPDKLIRKERFPKENHQGFLLASQMRGNVTSHGLHSGASARQKDFFATLKKDPLV